ncbi:MAG: hypothetical protein C5B52_15625 [Bacteroidetes bacterium]|nr:MAG: hypothetical protein C5B52_15625 [Bacteroidota bacterium]
MANNIERFVRDNRDSFDSHEPSPKVWENIENQMNLQSTPVRSINWKRWSVAAAVIVVLGSGTLWLVNRKPEAAILPIAKTETDTPNANKGETLQHNEVDIAAIDPDYAQQVAQFTSLIDKKQTELKSIEKDQPELYQKFSTDIQRLDSTYSALKLQLPVNPNKEELLQAMISNLQLQINLLNQQLNIIQKIKNSKTKGNEKNSLRT